MSKNKHWLLVTLGGLDVTAGNAGYEQNDVIAIGNNIGAMFISFLGVIFVALIIYAGVMWMTAAGNDSNIKTAKKLIGAAVIGLIIITAAYAFTTFIGDSFSIK